MMFWIDDPKLGTIEEELAACRKRFEGVKVGAFVWCCHHEIELEMLTEPPEARIGYILKEKSSIEQARRLYEFRPVLGKLPTKLAKTYAKLAKTRAELDNACSEWYKVRDELDNARGEWNNASAKWAKAYAERNEAYDEWDKAYAEYHVEIHALHVAEVPDTAWNGTSILGGV
jgi:hypothetical protein